MNISTIRNELLLDVQGCPIPKIDQAVIEAARLFCEESLCLKKTMTIDGTFAASAGGDYYIITTNLIQYNFWANLDPIDPITCKIDGIEYILTYFDMGDGLTDISDYVEGSQKFYFFVDQYTLQIFPFESTDSTVNIVISLAMKPTEDTTFIDDYLYLNFKNAIKQKALYLLKNINNVPWFNMEMALYHDSKYYEELGRARIRVKTGGFPVIQTAVGGYF